MNPFDMWVNMTRLAVMAAEAQAVISMRMLGMAGIWSVSPRENSMMVNEKAQRFPEAMTAAAHAVMRGGDPLAAAIKPLQRQTRANVLRLAKRGPQKVF